MTDAKNPSRLYNTLRVVVVALPVVVLLVCMQFGIEPGPVVVALSILPMAVVYFVLPLFLERIAERTTQERKRRAEMTDPGQRSTPANTAGDKWT